MVALAAELAVAALEETARQAMPPIRTAVQEEMAGMVALAGLAELQAPAVSAAQLVSMEHLGMAEMAATAAMAIPPLPLGSAPAMAALAAEAETRLVRPLQATAGTAVQEAPEEPIRMPQES